MPTLLQLLKEESMLPSAYQRKIVIMTLKKPIPNFYNAFPSISSPRILALTGKHLAGFAVAVLRSNTFPNYTSPLNFYFYQSFFFSFVIVFWISDNATLYVKSIPGYACEYQTEDSV